MWRGSRAFGQLFLADWGRGLPYIPPLFRSGRGGGFCLSRQLSIRTDDPIYRSTRKALEQLVHFFRTRSFVSSLLSFQSNLLITTLKVGPGFIESESTQILRRTRFMILLCVQSYRLFTYGKTPKLSMPITSVILYIQLVHVAEDDAT
jgi:hypothetical protein